MVPHVTCVTLYPQDLFLGIIRILTLADLADLSITKGDYSQAMIFKLVTIEKHILPVSNESKTALTIK